jgi:hydrogenase nickel incorporation protein HypB
MTATLTRPSNASIVASSNEVLPAPGDDKPAKYPVMFRAADLVLITKSDLLEVLGDFDPARAETCLRNLANTAPLFELSSRDGTGIDSWLDWLGSARSEAA